MSTTLKLGITVWAAFGLIGFVCWLGAFAFDNDTCDVVGGIAMFVFSACMVVALFGVAIHALWGAS